MFKPVRQLKSFRTFCHMHETYYSLDYNMLTDFLCILGTS